MKLKIVAILSLLMRAACFTYVEHPEWWGNVPRNTGTYKNVCMNKRTCMSVSPVSGW